MVEERRRSTKRSSTKRTTTSTGRRTSTSRRGTAASSSTATAPTSPSQRRGTGPAQSWFTFFVPAKPNWFLSFNAKGNDLMRYFAVRTPSGEDINAWVPEGCAEGSEILVKIGTDVMRRESEASRPQEKKMTYRTLTWTQLHLLCVERGLKPFGRRKDLGRRLAALDNQAKMRQSMAVGPLMKLQNKKALQVISVATLELVNAPRSHGSMTALTKMPYDDLLSICTQAGLTDRRIPHKVLATRLVSTARMLDGDEYKSLHARYHAGQIHPLVQPPASAGSIAGNAPPHRSKLTQGSTGVSRADDILAFAEIDSDQSGSITAEELQTALTRDGELDFKLRTCQLLMNMVDVDQNGRIDRFEFPVLLRYLADWEQAFTSYDLDKSGSIDATELKLAMDANGFTISSGFFGLLVMHYDSTGKGTLELDAFIQMFAEFTYLTQVFVSHTPKHAIEEKARFTQEQLITRCKRYTPERQLTLAFASNQLKSDPKIAEFEYEAFLYACIMK
jgi:Ca2+-binding EF-hand superfamily protein